MTALVARAPAQLASNTASAAGVVAVREATDHERDKWDELVSRFPDHLLSQRQAWLRSIAASTGEHPLYLVFERAGEVVGCLPGFVLRKALVRIFGSPFVGWQTDTMGPAFDPARVTTAELCAPLLPFLVERYGVHHVELAAASLDGESMRALGFRAVPIHSYRAQLFPGDESRMLRAMKDSARRNIRRADRLGLVARLEDGSDAFVNEHYDQIREVFTRRGSVVPFRRSRLAEFVRHMRAGGHLLCAAVYMPDGRTCIATGTFTVYDGVLRLWMWAHRTQYRWYRPTELLTWTVMRRAAAAQCVMMDFAGGGDFKAVFGAVPDQSATRWMWTRYAWLGQLRESAHTAYRWQQAARGRIARRLTTAHARNAVPPSHAD